MKRAHSARYEPSKRAESAQINHRTELSTEQIKEKEEAPLSFSGTILRITVKEEARLAGWFPSLDRQCEYITADAWCEEKRRHPKSALLFLRKWLLKTEKQSISPKLEARVGSGPSRQISHAIPGDGVNPKYRAILAEREMKLSQGVQ